MTESGPALLEKPLGNFALVFGVVLPAIAIMFELATQLCADIFFDPLPNWPMTILVAVVPLANLHIWYMSRSVAYIPRWAFLAYGAALPISFIFALIFLPLTPIAAIGVLYFGLGLLPMAPLFALIVAAIGIRRLSEVKSRVWTHVFAGIGIGFFLLMLADLPASATRVAIDMAGKGDTTKAATLMRWAGSEDDLLRLAHGATGRAGGLSSVFLTGTWGFGVWEDRLFNEVATARMLYFRTTGSAYNDSTSFDRLNDNDRRWRWDGDQGGDIVGGHVDTLRLSSSRIDGSISAENNVAYSEWTVEISNSGNRNSEARFTMVLPEGGVASRATLWVNGEPREASIAGRSEVKAAYKKIVRRQRDPLLVTTSGNGRLLVQAFPILPNDRMKFRVGFTAPLAIAKDGKRSISMPAIVEQNFKIDESLQHSIWMEGDVPNQQSGWAANMLKDGAIRLRASLTDTELRTMRPRILAQPIEQESYVIATVPAKRKAPSLSVKQTLELTDQGVFDGITILLDGSRSNQAAAQALVTALDGIEPNMPIGLMIASDSVITVKTAPWSSAQKTKFVDAVGKADFVGGIDNVAVLAEALDKNTAQNGAILWVHGPQPVEFPASVSALEQWIERTNSDMPKLLRYQAEAGRAFTIQESRFFETAREIAPSGNADRDLHAILKGISSNAPRWQLTWSKTTSQGSASSHIVKLWAADALANAVPYEGEAREEAISLAHRLNIITPVSGAVVLETDQDYDENGLPVPSSDEVPSVPEPHEWALIILLIFFVGWTLHRRGYSISGLFGQRLTTA